MITPKIPAALSARGMASLRQFAAIPFLVVVRLLPFHPGGVVTRGFGPTLGLCQNPTFGGFQGDALPLK